MCTPSLRSLRRSVAGGRARVASFELSLGLMLAKDQVIDCCMFVDPDLPFQECLPTVEMISGNGHTISG